MSILHFGVVNSSGDITGNRPVSASNPLPVTTSAALTPKGDQQISNATLAAATALTVPANSTVAVVQVDGQGVRWRDSGSNPTASVGILIGAGQSYVFQGATALAALKFIRVADGATLNVSYYG